MAVPEEHEMMERCFIGVDPGFSGAIARINAGGNDLQVWDMPITDTPKLRQRELDLGRLDTMLDSVLSVPHLVGLEWPTTRPAEGAERSERFGRQKGILESFLYFHHANYKRVAPNLWKGRLGLKGKAHEGANAEAAALFDYHYPDCTQLIRGPRGGILDGRMDALLIAHWLRMQSPEGMKALVWAHGKGTPEAMARLLQGPPSIRRSRPIRSDFD